MQDGAAFGRIDRLTREHRIASLLDAALGGEPEQERQGLAVDPVFREVGEDLRRLKRERVESLCIARECCSHVEARSAIAEGVLQE
jgi:hypothetical protein